MNPHAAMTAFVEVAQAGGFSAAARRLGISTTAISRQVAELEGMLGVTLLRRTTRHVSPTEAGARYLPRAAAILEEIAGLNAEISAVDTSLRGKLRITAPPAVGNDWIAPLAVDFIEAYPEIELEIEFTARLVDLLAEGFDAAIRSGPLASSSMIAHRIIEMRFQLCASPAYLARRGVPARPEDIAEHDCIHWLGATDSATWDFVREGVRSSVPISGRLWINNFAAEHEAARRGIGLAILPLPNLRDDIEAGRLIHLLPDYEVIRSTLSLVRPPMPFEPPKLRAFIDFITAALRERAQQNPAA